MCLEAGLCLESIPGDSQVQSGAGCSVGPLINQVSCELPMSAYTFPLHSAPSLPTPSRTPLHFPATQNGRGSGQRPTNTTVVLEVPRQVAKMGGGHCPRVVRGSCVSGATPKEPSSNPEGVASPHSPYCTRIQGCVVIPGEDVFPCRDSPALSPIVCPLHSRQAPPATCVQTLSPSRLPLMLP